MIDRASEIQLFQPAAATKQLARRQRDALDERELENLRLGRTAARLFLAQTSSKRLQEEKKCKFRTNSNYFHRARALHHLSRSALARRNSESSSGSSQRESRARSDVWLHFTRVHPGSFASRMPNCIALSFFISFCCSFENELLFRAIARPSQNKQPVRSCSVCLPWLSRLSERWKIETFSRGALSLRRAKFI